MDNETINKKKPTRKPKQVIGVAEQAFSTYLIQQTAYQFYEERGKVDGHELEDWLRAEQLFVKRYTL
jgi:hypothetical protein